MDSLKRSLEIADQLKISKVVSNFDIDSHAISVQLQKSNENHWSFSIYDPNKDNGHAHNYNPLIERLCRIIGVTDFDISYKASIIKNSGNEVFGGYCDIISALSQAALVIGPAYVKELRKMNIDDSLGLFVFTTPLHDHFNQLLKDRLKNFQEEIKSEDIQITNKQHKVLNLDEDSKNNPSKSVKKFKVKKIKKEKAHQEEL